MFSISPSLGPTPFTYITSVSSGFFKKFGRDFGCPEGFFRALTSSLIDDILADKSSVEYLENNGIGTRQLFAGNILRQPVFVDNDEIRFRVGNSKILSSKDLSSELYSKLPNTEFIMNSTFWVGTFPKLGEEEMAKIADTIKKFIEENT